MYQIFTIALRYLYTTFTDRNLLIIMIATPLLLSTIIGLAFGGGGQQDINLVIVNQDAGAESAGNPLNYGDQLITILRSIAGNTDEVSNTPPDCDIPGAQSDASPDNNEFTLNLGIAELASPDEAREAVESGQFAVAVIVPPDYSANLIQLSDASSTSPIMQTEIEVYGNSGQSLAAGIVKNIVEGITSQTITGNIAIRATIEALLSDTSRLTAMATVEQETYDAFACGFTGALNTLTLDRQPIDSVQSASVFIQIVVTIGSAQAAFFAMFTAVQNILAIYSERDSGTLARIMVAPIPRWYVLAGNVMGTFLMVVLQVVFLMIGLIAVASFVEGELTLIWGTNIIHLIAVILSLSLSVSGVGVLVVGLSKDVQQANIFSPIVSILIAFLGGAFGVQLPRFLQQFSLIFWGSDAFDKLSVGNTDIALNIIFLTVLGAITFSVGTWLFSRRIGI